MTNQNPAPVTRPDFDAIKARAEAASEGPWSYEFGFPWQQDDGSYYEPTESGVIIHSQNYEISADHADAEFIAHAREDIPTLLAALADLAKASRKLKRERDEARRHARQMQPHFMDLTNKLANADFDAIQGRKDAWDEGYAEGAKAMVRRHYGTTPSIESAPNPYRADLTAGRGSALYSERTETS